MSAPVPTATTIDPTRPTVLVVAVALISHENRVLLAQRPKGKSMAGLWEFPGGKIETNEIPELALKRELFEELAIGVEAEDLKPLTFASHAYERFHLLMPVYACRRWFGTLNAREGQTLAWVPGDKLTDFQMPPADAPLVPVLRDYLARARPLS
jgi:8-oxo-dGTP diphosphatase